MSGMVFIDENTGWKIGSLNWDLLFEQVVDKLPPGSFIEQIVTQSLKGSKIRYIEVPQLSSADRSSLEQALVAAREHFASLSDGSSEIDFGFVERIDELITMLRAYAGPADEDV